jgi:hypothetical protein
MAFSGKVGASWKTENENRICNLRVGKITSGGRNTGSLKLRLWATTTYYDGQWSGHIVAERYL